MKKRIDYLDTAKGILILLMLYGHVFLDGAFRQFLYTFHMPAFFIISGMLLCLSESWINLPLIKILKNKTYRLIIPFLFFECIGVFTDIVRFGFTLNLKGYIYNTITMNCNNGPDWFLFVLFVDEMMFIIIHRYINQKYIQVIITFLIGVMLIINHCLFPCAGQVGIGLLFLCCGFLLCKLFQFNNAILTVISGLMTVMITILNGKVDMAEWYFGVIPLYIIGSITGTYFVINISKSISSRLLTFFGKNTLIILGTHQAILLPIRHYAKMPVFSIINSTIIFIAITLIEIPIIYVFNRYIPFLCGKKNLL